MDNSTAVFFFKSAFVVFALVAFLERVMEIALHKGEKGAVTENWTRDAMIACHLVFFFGSLFELLMLRRYINLFLSLFGLTSFLIGFVLRKWSIMTLGRFWSISIEMRPNHTLVTGGPYRYCRHPNYLAILFEMIGFCLVANAYFTLIVSLVAYPIVLFFRIRLEESAMIKTFRRTYVQYRRKTAALIPFFI